MKKLLLLVALIPLLLVSISCDKLASNPFIGEWDNGTSFHYVFRARDYTIYYLKSSTSYTGEYSYNATQGTLMMERSSGTHIYVVQSVSSNRIVFFDPDDMYVWTLIRTK